MHEVLADRLDGLLLLLRSRHERPGLDFKKHAGEFHKLTHLLDREFLEHGEVVAELFGDHRDRHLHHVHLVLLDEVKQQVERPGEDVEGDLEFHGAFPGGSGGATQPHYRT